MPDKGDFGAFTNWHAHLLQSIRLRASYSFVGKSATCPLVNTVTDVDSHQYANDKIIMSKRTRSTFEFTNIPDSLPIVPFAEYIGLSAMV